MKRTLLIITATFLVITTSFGQKWIPEIICSTDTLIVEPYPVDSRIAKYNPDKIDTLRPQPYKMVECRTRSNIGLRVDLAVSNYYYQGKTKDWIGQHGGPNFNFVFVVDKLNLGFRFKPWTTHPLKELDFQGQILPTTADLNVIRMDYYVGYSFDFDKLISLEPYIGYNQSSFLVINEDELNQKFNFKGTGGFILGTTLNKYFKVKDYEYFTLFGTAGYGFVDYEKVHPELDNGYFEWNIGIAYKGFLTKRLNKKIK